MSETFTGKSFFEYIPRNNLAQFKEFECSAFKGNAKLLSKVVVPIHTSTSTVPSNPHPLKH